VYFYGTFFAFANKLLVMQSYTSFGHQSFCSSGAATWNNMPLSMRSSDQLL